MSPEPLPNEALQMVLEAMKDGVIVVHGTQRLYVNQAYVDIQGLSSIEEAMTLAPGSTIATEEERTAVREMTAARGRGEDVPSVFTYRIRRPDGELRSIESHTSTIGMGGDRYTVAAIRDVTETLELQRRQVEATEALREAELRSRLILDSAGDGIYGVDIDGNVTFVNRAGAGMLGYTQQQLLGRRAHDLVHHSYPDGRPYPFERCPMYLALHDAETHYVTDEVLWRPDGTSFPVHYSSTPIVHGGVVQGAVIAFSDVSEHLRVEQMKSQFVSTVSHELRTPLTAIRGYVGLLLNGVAGQLPEQAMKMLGTAQANTERLIRLINDILDMEKVESGRMEFFNRPVVMTDLVRQTLEANQGFAAERNVRLEMVAVVPDAQVMADSDRFAQVLTNLVSNAIKFSPPNAAVEVAMTQRGDRLRVTVHDHGTGVPEAFRPRLFERFAQADSSDTRAKGGTGLGLSISQAIVERLGGTLGFEAPAGGGASFFAELPVYVAEEAPVITEASHSRVLVVEDDLDVALLLRKLLEHDGYDVDVAHDTTQARHRLSQGAYCAVTVDIRLPGETGVGLIRSLHASPQWTDIPVIVVSAYTEEAQSELRGTAIAVQDWIAKPIDEHRLLQAVEHACSHAPGQPAHILHVEDDADLANLVRVLLGGRAELTVAPTIEAARHALAAGRFDLVLLDLSLPDGRGEELLSEVGATPVVIFTGQEADEALLKRVNAVLVKSRVSDAQLRNAITQLLDSRRPRA